MYSVKHEQRGFVEKCFMKDARETTLVYLINVQDGIKPTGWKIESNFRKSKIVIEAPKLFLSTR